MSRSRKELLEICKKNKIKGVSKKRKDELIQIIKKFDERTLLFNRSDFLEKVKGKILDNKDPITLELIEEWTDEELQKGIIINQYFYKEETLIDYINSTDTKKVRDPIQTQLFIDPQYIEKYRKKEKKLDPSQIKIVLDTCCFPTLYNNFYFYKMYLKIDAFPPEKIITNLVYHRRKKAYYIGCIPFNINLSNDIISAFEMRALDTMSTTDALLVRITNFFQLQKTFSMQDEKILIQPLQYLPKLLTDWFSMTDDFMYIDTEPIQENQPLSTYNKLLTELDKYSI